MTIAKDARSRKRQKGQFLTPRSLARRLLSDFVFTTHDRVLEPGFGDGSFLIPLIDTFMRLYDGSPSQRLAKVLTCNIWGVEVDRDMFDKALLSIEEHFGQLPDTHNLLCQDFFETTFRFGNTANATGVAKTTGGFDREDGFTYIIGNPPFGGTIAKHLQDALDKTLGFRYGYKIKKETYAFFTVKSMDLLSFGGQLRFICSDTFLTISTMKGLRYALSKEGFPSVRRLDVFSAETSYPMVVLDWTKTGPSSEVSIDGALVSLRDIRTTDNQSWGLTSDMVAYFRGPTIGEVMVGTSGMTTGNNDLFIRQSDGLCVLEPYDFVFEASPITLEQELKRARLGKLSLKKINEIKSLEKRGATEQTLQPVRRQVPLKVNLPHPDYVPYNKAIKGIIYQPTTHYIYWRNNGEALLTYKRTGNWYLRGVGGAPYFFREGLTWRLVSSSLDVRYLPAGHILDSGAPSAFLRHGVPQEELYFILGWTLTRLCNRILKQVINHTHNIQSKDFERLPYPYWVSTNRKRQAIGAVRWMIEKAIRGDRTYTREDKEMVDLELLYEYAPDAEIAVSQTGWVPEQMELCFDVCSESLGRVQGGDSVQKHQEMATGS